MEKNTNCSSSNIKLDKDNNKKGRTICKNCYNEKKTEKRIRTSSLEMKLVSHTNNQKLIIIRLTIPTIEL